MPMYYEPVVFFKTPVAKQEPTTTIRMWIQTTLITNKTWHSLWVLLTTETLLILLKSNTTLIKNKTGNSRGRLQIDVKFETETKLSVLLNKLLQQKQAYLQPLEIHLIAVLAL